MQAEKEVSGSNAADISEQLLLTPILNYAITTKETIICIKKP